MPFPSYYARLGIEPTSSPEEIRRAFRAAVKRLPPTDASEQWREILEAYAVLRDPRARRRYDARCRGRAWGLQIAARLPRQRGAPSRMRLVLGLGLATSRWVIHRVIARRHQGGKAPPERRLLALPTPAGNRRGTAVSLLDAFVSEVHRLLATKAGPEELTRTLSNLLASYRNEAASHLRDLGGVPLHITRPCEDGDTDALALMVIWGLQQENGTGRRDGRSRFRIQAADGAEVLSGKARAEGL